MKTQHLKEVVADFLKMKQRAYPETVQPLVEGHSSQAFRFRTDEGEYVCRLGETDRDFRADLFAYTKFGKNLPIPAVKTIGRYDDNTFYCITNFAIGKTTNTLSDEEMRAALPDIQRMMARIFSLDTSFSNGYGDIDVKSGNAEHETWQDKLREIKVAGRDSFKRHAGNIELDSSVVDSFFVQFEKNLQFASKERRLLHGDPAFDNMLVDNNKVTAVLDWAQMGYGDWMSDFARLDFWWPGRYGDAKEFAGSYQLEADNISERKALYWATNALWTIEFADKAQSKSVTKWLHEHIRQKLI